MAGDEVVPATGAESVHQSVGDHTKADFTFFAMTKAEGEKLPLILIAKGKTNRCHAEFRGRQAYDVEIWHSPSEWPTETFMLQYLD
jgi:hypothetical protein